MVAYGFSDASGNSFGKPAVTGQHASGVYPIDVKASGAEGPCRPPGKLLDKRPVQLTQQIGGVPWRATQPSYLEAIDNEFCSAHCYYS
jgi:hypothetical protein